VNREATFTSPLSLDEGEGALKSPSRGEGREALDISVAKTDQSPFPALSPAAGERAG